MRAWTAVPAMRFGAMVVVLLAVSDFEHQFIKGFASLNLNAAAMLSLMFIFRPLLAWLAGGQPAAAAKPAAASPVGASTP